MRELDYFYDHPYKNNGANGFISCIEHIVSCVFKVCFRQKNMQSAIVGKASENHAVIIAGNHTSLADPLFVFFSLMPGHLRFLGKKELFRIPVLRRIFAWGGVIPIDRDQLDQRAIKRALRCLKSGENLGIFPEGTRVRKPGQLSEPETGVASFAMLTNSLIVPCGLSGPQRIRPYGKIFFRFPKVIVKYGEPIDWHDFEFLPKTVRAQAITDEVMRRVNILKVGGEPGGLPDLAVLYADSLDDSKTLQKECS